MYISFNCIILSYSLNIHFSIFNMAAGRSSCFIPVCNNFALTSGRSLELRHIRLISCIRQSRLSLAASKALTSSRRLIGDDSISKSSTQSPPSAASESASSQSTTSTEHGGEKVSYDRNFITALRAMQDFLLKPG